MRGCEVLGRFNLIDEPWISVIIDKKGNTNQVSLRDIFKNAHEYYGLAGETKTQDFAVFRVLLAVVHTVFSRFNADGGEYGYFTLNDRYGQEEDIDENDLESYVEDLYRTWIEIWEARKFPPIVNDYLSKWHERFYLFDAEYPFYQLTKEDILPEKLNKSNASSISGKNINRLISESSNKIALFSPKFEAENNKEKLNDDEIARWLITFQNYTGLSDKAIFGKEKYKASKGWLFDLGGIALKGKNLFETLLLNSILVPGDSKYEMARQKPCWEFTSGEKIRSHFSRKPLDNLSELYTIWSRGIYIDPATDSNLPFVCEVVKLPDIDHQNQFLEPMTLWRYNENGENKDKFTPRKYPVNQSIWRSFGLIAISYDGDEKTKPNRRPGIIDWFEKITEKFNNFDIALQAIGMQDDGNATSWVPVDEFYDTLNIHDIVLTDIEEYGWTPRINDVVEETKKAIGFTYRNFIGDIKEIRNLRSNDFVNHEVEKLYFMIDGPFRNWIVSITPQDSKDDKIFEWRNTVKEIIINQAQEVVRQAGTRDYKGIIVDEHIKNIATAYNRFNFFLSRQLRVEEVKNNG